MQKTTKFMIICLILIAIGICLLFIGFSLGGSIYGVNLSPDGLYLYTTPGN